MSSCRGKVTCTVFVFALCVWNIQHVTCEQNAGKGKCKCRKTEDGACGDDNRNYDSPCAANCAGTKTRCLSKCWHPSCQRRGPTPQAIPRASPQASRRPSPSPSSSPSPSLFPSLRPFPAETPSKATGRYANYPEDQTTPENSTSRPLSTLITENVKLETPLQSSPTPQVRDTTNQASAASCDFHDETLPNCGCPAVCDPACGSDSRTYENACVANCVGVEFQCLGECPCRLRFPSPYPSPSRYPSLLP